MKLTQLSIIGLLLAAPVPGVTAGSAQLLQQLQADYAALTAAESDFQRRQERGELSRSGAADYATYLEGLRERVVADCRALLQAGSSLPADVPCATLTPLSQPLLVPEQSVPRSRSERISILDGELEAGLSAFDELLLREQERVRASAPRSAQEGTGAGAGSGEESGQPGAVGDDGLARTQPPGGSGAADGGAEQEGSSAADGPRGAGRGASTAEQRAEVGGRPADIPDGSDDDVVARQLREAAEKETDPELKKKLWEEYRRYKKGIR